MSTERDYTPPAAVEEALARLNDLATLPEVAQRVMEAANDPDSDADDVERLVSGDAVLASRVLKVVNSSFYGMPGQVASIHQAVVVLGLNAVRNIAVAASLGKLFRGTQLNDFYDARELWEHSTTVACASRLLAKKAGLDPEVAFLLGMLHDIGFVLEAQFARARLGDAVRRKQATPDASFIALETEAVGASHQDFGRELCARWQFPLLFQQVVGCHHEPERLEGDAHRLAVVLAVADRLAQQLGAGYIGTLGADELPAGYLDELGVSEDDVEDILAELPAARELASVISG